MDGHISVVSTEGKGSTFTFTLRCKRPPTNMGSQGSAKLVSETKMKENLSYSTANVHKLQAGMCYPVKAETVLSSFHTYQVLDDDRGPRRSALVDVTSYRLPAKLPRGSLKVRNTNDSDYYDLLDGSREKARSLEEESYSHTASWAARQGTWNESRDRGGAKRGGLRRTSSGPSRIDSLMMADLDHSKSVPATSSSAPVVDKKLPSLLLAEDNKVRSFKRNLSERLLDLYAVSLFGMIHLIPL
jgi:hypothetical protein